MDVFGVEEDENYIGKFRKQQLFSNAFVHGFIHNFQLVNHFGLGFKALER